FYGGTIAGTVRVAGREPLTAQPRGMSAVVGFVFQDPETQFVVDTVESELVFAMENHNLPPATMHERLEGVLDRLAIRHLRHRRISTLSGGEKQRVAIGRALLSAPRLILMDEPLSSLDRARRQEILPYIERIRDEVKIPVIYVSHALDEVARLANRVVLLEDGRVRAEGEPREVFPELSHGQEGMAPQSILEARIVGHEAHFGLSMAEIGDSIVTLQPVDLPEGTPVRIRVPATDVMIALDRHADLSALNQLPGTVAGVEPDGRHVLVTVDCHGQRLVARITLLSAERLGLRPGLRVHALFKAVAVDGASVYRVPGAPVGGSS
ncbi:MAG TPA: TOBE domain-containing protein, partial [Alphaproteobacteria bacterium]|nr:TOBE domain-containing protein [Alphaproteobacteria bacterium]